MPASYPHQTVYLGQRGSFDTFNEASLYKAGELGQRAISVDNLQYQLVQLDSGVTANTGPGVAAANQVAYWKDKSKYLVTNDGLQAVGGQGATSEFRNEVAGIIRNAATSAYYIWVLQKGRNINVKSASGTYLAGEWSVPNTGTAADSTRVAAGTAPGIRPLGIVAGAKSGANTPVDLDIPGIE